MGHSVVPPLLLELDAEVELALELDDAAPPEPPAPPPEPVELDEALLLDPLDELDVFSPELPEFVGGSGLAPCSSRQDEATREKHAAMNEQSVKSCFALRFVIMGRR